MSGLLLVQRQPIQDAAATTSIGDPRSLERYRSLAVRMAGEATQRPADERSEVERITSGFGWVIEQFNAAQPPDPQRWQAVVAGYREAAERLGTALSVPEGPGAAQRREPAQLAGIVAFVTAARLATRYENELSAYLGQNMQANRSVVHGTRDVALAAAVGVAVVALTPAAYALSTAALANTAVGGSTAAAGALTAFALGTTGAGLTAGARAGIAFVDETAEIIKEVLVNGEPWEVAVSRFDWAGVGASGWDGFKRGFVDGVLAVGAAGLALRLAALARAGSARLLGMADRTVLGRMLEIAGHKATAGAATGAVVGALQAGAGAAFNGADLGGVVAAMQTGFILGGATGAAFGAVAGGRDALRYRTGRQIGFEILEHGPAPGVISRSERRLVISAGKLDAADEVAPGWVDKYDDGQLAAGVYKSVLVRVSVKAHPVMSGVFTTWVERLAPGGRLEIVVTKIKADPGARMAAAAIGNGIRRTPGVDAGSVQVWERRAADGSYVMVITVLKKSR